MTDMEDSKANVHNQFNLKAYGDICIKQCH